MLNLFICEFIYKNDNRVPYCYGRYKLRIVAKLYTIFHKPFMNFNNS